MNWICCVACFMAVGMLMACEDSGSSSPAEPCPDGELIEFEGDAFCILIEEGFLTSDCPSDFPNGHQIEDIVVCSADEGELPSRLEANLRGRGFLSTEFPNADCAEEVEFRELVAENQACEVDDDCQLFLGFCAFRSVCEVAVSNNVSRAELEAIVTRSLDNEACQSLCDCFPPPDASICQDGVCVFQR